MSAPTAVDAAAVAEGLAWHVDPPSLGPRTRTTTVERDRRDLTSSVAQLSRTYDELCTQAVDAYEIAAGLEAAGINDRIARLVYGCASVFDLADTLYAMVPRRPVDMGAPPDRWHRPLQRHLLRGLLYGLPGLLYAVAFGTLTPGAGPVLLLCATILACGLGQGVSVIGNMLTGWGEHRAAMSLFRFALVGGVVLLGVLSALGWLSGTMLSAGVLAGIQIEYLLAATVLLVLHADRLLLAILLPGVLLAAAALAGMTDVVQRPLVLGFLALCPVAASVVAAVLIRRSDVPSGASLREVLGSNRSVVRLGWTYVAYGAANAGLVSFAVVDVLTRGDDDAGGSIVLMMLPLVASLGVAEWLVHRLRSRGAIVLHETTSAGTFRSRAAAALLRSVLGYAGVVGALAAAVVLLYQLPAATGRIFVLSTASYAVLGVAFLLETLLLSLGRHGLALGLAASALVADTALRFVLAGEPTAQLELAHLTVFTTLLVILVPTTVHQYRSVGMHR
jgi:hypothetical protein